MLAGRFKYVVVGLIWLASLIGIMGWVVNIQQTHITIAGGPRSSESFEIATAIAEVFSQQHSNYKVEVFETSGSAENVRLLESGLIDLAPIQADTAIAGNIDAVASLYFDAYQLIARDGLTTSISSFADLPGHRIAIPPTSSGQNAAFWFLADHYGITEQQVAALPMSEAAANFAMIQGQVDAVFRVRVPGNDAIRELIGDHLLRLVPIEQSAALSLKKPAISPGMIPHGSYRGYPALPAQDLPTAAMERILAARADLDQKLVYKLTQLLFEHRSDLVSETHLAGMIRGIDHSTSRTIPVHQGALSYYDREKPSFVQQNTRLSSAILSAIAIITSAVFALRSRWQLRRRIRVGEHNKKLMQLAEEVSNTTDTATLTEYKTQLRTMLQDLVDDLDQDRVNQNEFEHFQFVWQSVDNLLRDQWLQATANKGEQR
ncbi:TAXI family TRAP transporter solute-binding subunit [Oceanicoccus sagamiensis]|uniref:Uncharacterized protein n=1 Tax=Oceanicoccus sagamiensis TaxID=716816 RepID=A0A1X9NE04_9GAMM|nr:TAXI family TRAP transporter solute-binding subunit [Oceanicoccus sagamiensis]ARN74652.1 hypothetical protein BST96_11270 [Oceanicoccus sagamiensis]